MTSTYSPVRNNSVIQNLSDINKVGTSEQESTTFKGNFAFVSREYKQRWCHVGVNNCLSSDSDIAVFLLKFYEETEAREKPLCSTCHTPLTLVCLACSSSGQPQTSFSGKNLQVHSQHINHTFGQQSDTTHLTMEASCVQTVHDWSYSDENEHSTATHCEKIPNFLEYKDCTRMDREVMSKTSNLPCSAQPAMKCDGKLTSSQPASLSAFHEPRPQDMQLSPAAHLLHQEDEAHSLRSGLQGKKSQSQVSEKIAAERKRGPLTCDIIDNKRKRGRPRKKVLDSSEQFGLVGNSQQRIQETLMTQKTESKQHKYGRDCKVKREYHKGALQHRDKEGIKRVRAEFSLTGVKVKEEDEEFDNLQVMFSLQGAQVEDQENSAEKQRIYSRLQLNDDDNSSSKTHSSVSAGESSSGNSTKSAEWKPSTKKRGKSLDPVATTDVKKVNQWRCPLCPSQFLLFDDCSKHISTHRSNRCDMCSSVFKSRARLSRHKYRVHSGIKFDCETCGKSLSSKFSLQVHERIHSGDKPFQCPDCEKSFRIKTLLEYHCHKEHLKISFNCQMCEASFLTKRNLKSHMLVHSNVREFLCEDCGWSFKQKITLQEHVKVVHKNIRDFPCHLCDYKFATKNQLQAHLRSSLHYDCRDHICTECGTAFSSKSGLKVHFMLHSGEKPWQCDRCDKAFRRKHMLLIHQRIHNGTRPAVCDVCGHGFQTRGNMRKHRNTVHKDAPPLPYFRSGKLKQKSDFPRKVSKSSSAPNRSKKLSEDLK